MSQMLQGLTVLDLASVGPAARASRWLADYGARVIKIGPVPANAGVQLSPPYFAYSGQHGIERVSIDLKAPEGLDTFLRLSDTVDVIIESFRPGVVDRLGIGHSVVSARNSDIIYCSISGYGQQGVRADWAGHDLNYLALSGYLANSTRGPGGKPPIPGATVADSAGGGLQAVVAILAALHSRNAGGEGSYLDISVTDGVLELMSLQIDEYLATEIEPGPGHSLLTGKYACYDTYPCQDGKWLAVGAIEPKFWSNLCQALDLKKWTGHQLDDDVQDLIKSDFRAVFRTKDRDDWANTLGPIDTCVAPVLSVAEAASDPQMAGRQLLTTASHPRHGDYPMMAPGFAGTTKLGDKIYAADVDVSGTDEVLVGSGFSKEEVSTLRGSGAIW